MPHGPTSSLIRSTKWVVGPFVAVVCVVLHGHGQMDRGLV